MNRTSRRRFLAAGALGAVGALAGCTGDRSGGSDATPTGGGSDGSGGSQPPPTGTGRGDVDLPVPRSELVRGAAKDAIPAITEPVFDEDWSGVSVEGRDGFGQSYTIEPRMNPEDRVIGVERAGEARAYPLKVLNWHEIVNDSLGGPLLVTYCPLCGSGVTAVRTVNDRETIFGVSGFLFRNDLVMYDELTGSLWSQIMATAINGPETGETLELVPSTLTTWGAWRDQHDDAVVLRPPPDSNTVTGRNSTRDYSINPYAGYDSSRRIGIGGSFEDDRLHPKAQVIGIAHDGVARAYPLETVQAEGVVNDSVGGLPVVVAVAPGETLVAYERRVEGTTLTFESAGDGTMAGGGSRWSIASGEALDGPFEGTQLPRANDTSPMFFFAWLDFNEDTEVYTASG